MRVRILFFGVLKDLAGRPSEEADFAGGADLRTVFDTVAARCPPLREMAPSIVVARNREFADLSTKIEDGDEVAFLPPVSGGTGTLPADPLEIAEDGNYFALTYRAIDARRIVARLLTGAEGAVVTFEGTVRNQTKGRPVVCLDYECYQPMALKMMAQIGREIAGAHQVTRVAMVHRLGRLLIGETSVAVIATAPHRRAAFEAALQGIDRLKKTVPIWKKEHFVDGEVWVEGEWDRDVPVAG
jgi:molybdopterin synthase catalytic subunit